MKFLKQLILLSFLVVSASLSTNAVGVVDWSYGTNGRTVANTDVQSRFVRGFFQSDGKFVACTTTTNLTTALYRYNTNGTLDATFGANGVLTFLTLSINVSDVAVQTDGKFVFVGASTSGQKFAVMRILASGAADPSFGTNGLVITTNDGGLNRIALQTDGKIVAAGYTTNIVTGTQQVVLRFNTNGTPDSTFANGLLVFNYPAASNTVYRDPSDLKVLANGNILVGGSKNIISGGGAATNTGFALMMVDPAGTPVPSFGTQGFATAVTIRSIDQPLPINFEVLPSGNVFVACYSGNFLLNSVGQLIRMLPFEGAHTRLTPNGRVLVSGDSIDPNAKVGAIKLYSETNLIGKAVGPGTAFAAPDGSIIVADLDTATNRLTVSRFFRLTSQGTRMVDFDHDDKTDFAVLRDGGQFNDSTVHMRLSSGPLVQSIRVGHRAVIIPEQFTTDLNLERGRRDQLLYANMGFAGLSATVFHYKTYTDTGSATGSYQWGTEGDIPVGGDFDGSGYSDVTVFRPTDGYWYSYVGDNNQPRYFKWGQTGDQPVPADYDYDGKTDFAIFRPSTGDWWISRSSDQSVWGVHFGISTDIPLTGDYDGDGYADLCVYRASQGTWYQYLSTTGFNVVQFGLSTDIPVPGDYDGDGKTDIAVWRPTSGTWYLLQSHNGVGAVIAGSPGDKPLAIKYDH